MRSIGFVLFLMLLILIGFGFLLSDNLSVRGELAAAKDQVELITSQAKAIQEQYNAVNNENDKYINQINQLLEENKLLKGELYYLQTERFSTECDNSVEQNTVSALTPEILWLSSLKLATNNSLALAIFIPFFPISIGTAYILVRRHAKYSRHTEWNNAEKQERILEMKVTPEEMRRVRNLRRGK